MVAAVIWFIFYRTELNDKNAGVSMAVAEAVRKLTGTPRYAFGVVARFFYVGMQISFWVWTIKYIMTTKGWGEAEAAEFFICSTPLFIVCR